MAKSKYIFLLTIFIISFIVSAILAFSHIEQVCKGSEITCSTVQNSDYRTSFGVSNNYLGLFAFGVMVVLTFSHIKKPKKYKKHIITLGILLGSAMAIYFIYLQFFVLKILCKYCMIVNTGTLLSLGIIFAWKEK